MTMRGCWLPGMVAVGLLCATPAAQQIGGADEAALGEAIGRLGSFDHTERLEAARAIRRADAAVVVPLLAAAARAHASAYVRYRALTLLAGFGAAAAAPVMADLRGDRNDRVRMVVYAWFEHHPDPAVLPSLVEALKTEDSEFVRPALTRALAAQAADPRARDAIAPFVLRGADFFRGSVIEALGEYGGRFAAADIASVAELDGPLQVDAIVALGRLGEPAYLARLAALQRTSPAHVQPALAASLCLLGHACEETGQYLRETVAFAAREQGHQRLLRSAAHALGVLAIAGRDDALDALLDAGTSTELERLRAPVALAVGTVALKQPGHIVRVLERRDPIDPAVRLLGDAFDQLAEDFEEERFFAAVRSAYWAAPAGSARRRVAEILIRELEF